MRALKFNRVGEVEVTDEPEPEPGPGEVLVHTAFAGICGSDLHGIRPGGYRTPPLIMGHEFTGTTDDGRRVTVNATLSCGVCDMCRSGREHICRNRKILGIDRQGGLAERVAVPESALVDLSPATSLQAAALVEPLAVAVRGWRRSGAKAGDRVGIVGAGNIGLLLLAVGRDSGAEITIIDVSPSRRGMAEREGGATVAKALDGEYDVVFDAVGAVEVHLASVRHLAPGGTAVWIGSRSPDPAFDALDLVRSEKNVIASFAYTGEDFQKAVALAASLTLDWVEIVDLEQSARVFMDLYAGRSDIVKAVVQTGADRTA